MSELISRLLALMSSCISQQGQGTLQQLQGENARLKEELDNAKRDLEAARNRKPMQENPDRPMPSAGVSGAGVSGAGLVSSTQLADQEREMESLRALLVQANEAMQNMEDEKKRVESEFERSRFHEQVAEDRQALLQERDRQLMEAHKREDDLQMKLRELDRELKGVRDAALTEKGRQTDQNQLVESLQQQLEQMQLLALSQSREAEAAMIAMGDLKSIEMDQTSEILRLNALVADLEEHQKVAGCVCVCVCVCVCACVFGCIGMGGGPVSLLVRACVRGGVGWRRVCVRGRVSAFRGKKLCVVKSAADRGEPTRADTHTDTRPTGGRERSALEDQTGPAGMWGVGRCVCVCARARAYFLSPTPSLFQLSSSPLYFLCLICIYVHTHTHTHTHSCLLCARACACFACVSAL